MSNDPQTRRRLDLIVFLGLALYIGAVCYKAYTPHTFIFRDGSFYAQVNRSIAEGFTLRQEAVQPSSWYDGSLPWYRNIDDAWSNVSVGVNGEWYPKHSYLMPVFSTPLFILFGPPGLLLFNALALVLALFSGYLLAARYAGPTASAVAALMIGTSPLISFLAYSYSHDVTAGRGVRLAGRPPVGPGRPAAGTERLREGHRDSHRVAHGACADRPEPQGLVVDRLVGIYPPGGICHVEHADVRPSPDHLVPPYPDRQGWHSAHRFLRHRLRHAPGPGVRTVLFPQP